MNYDVEVVPKHQVITRNTLSLSKVKYNGLHVVLRWVVVFGAKVVTSQLLHYGAQQAI